MMTTTTKARTAKNCRSIINKCIQCRIARLCLPASIDQNKFQQLSELQFKARLLKPGDHLCRQGEKIDHLYAIKSGLLKSYITQEDGQEFVMGFYLSPNLFGWEGIDSRQLSTSIVALDHSNICEIPTKKLEQIVHQAPEIETQILQLVSRRIHHDNMVMLRTNAEHRVANFLLQLLDYNSQLGQPDSFCRLVMTHQDIANYLRMAPETISRTFRKLEKKELITASKHEINILNLQRLKEIAQMQN